MEAIAVVVLASVDLLWSLKVLKTHTTVSVPDDVAMHDPGTWIVSLETNDGPARCECNWGTETSEQSSVSSNGVIEIKLANHTSGEDTSALAKHREVVTVKMHWVRCLEVVLDNEVYPVTSGTIEHNSIGIDGAVVGQVRHSCEGLEGWLVEGDINGLATNKGSRVSRQVGGTTQEPSVY